MARANACLIPAPGHLSANRVEVGGVEGVRAGGTGEGVANQMTPMYLRIGPAQFDREGVLLLGDKPGSFPLKHI